MEIAQSKGIMLDMTKELDTTPIDFMAWTTIKTDLGISFFVNGNIASEIEIKAMMAFAKLNNLFFNSVDFYNGKICFLCLF